MTTSSATPDADQVRHGIVHLAQDAPLPLIVPRPRIRTPVASSTSSSREKVIVRPEEPGVVRERVVPAELDTARVDRVVERVVDALEQRARRRGTGSRGSRGGASP